MSKTGQATTVGATSGAVGGAVVGGPVGAVAGAAIGGIAGHEMAKSESTNPTTTRSDSSGRTTATGTSRTDSSTSDAYSSNAGTANTTANATGVAQGSTIAMNGEPPSTSSDAERRSVSREDDIRAIQQSLNDQGYDAGSVDGIWGPKTAGAVRKFQADHGLQPTGRPDAETRTALGLANGAVSARDTSPMKTSANTSPSHASDTQ